MDTKLLNNPVFREEDSGQWRTKLGMSYEQPKKSTFNAFEDLAVRDDPYIEGLQALG